MGKVWEILNANEDILNTLKEELKIHEQLCRILVHRGIHNFTEAKDFFRPSKDHLHNPFLMKGMDSAIKRISYALNHNQKIMIYGDYDVDGTTAVSVVYSFLKDNFPQNEFIYYIPHRYREGYGISLNGIDEAKSLNCQLIIALDCGIKANEKVAYASSLDIDFIICDHHIPDKKLPEAVAILNPKQKDCLYPYKELSGCGIGYKLICAMAEQFNLPPSNAEIYLDMVALSIAADIVPLNGENCVLAYLGIQKLQENPCLGIRLLKEKANFSGILTNSDLVFLIAPRINAAGRMDDAKKAVALFTEKKEEIASEIAQDLHELNTKRKIIDQQMTAEAIEIIKKENNTGNRTPKTTVVYHPDWHKGVVGIVASRLIEHFYRPTIVLTYSEGKITGSARSVEGINIHSMLKECSHLLESFGGHYFAAGLTLLPENFEQFKALFERIIAEKYHQHLTKESIKIDAELNLNDLSDNFYKILNQYEPFGPENLRPVFLAKKVRDWHQYSRIIKGQHIQFVISQKDNYAFSGIGFNLADKFPIVTSGDYFDIVYTIEKNEWQGKSRLQLRIIDLKESSKGE